MVSQNRTAKKPEISTSTLINRSISVVLTNLVPIYGVVYLGWDSFGLVFLFIMEGVIVLVADAIKVQFLKKEKGFKNNFALEFCFILFFGFFALLVYGPYASLENLISDKLHLIKEIIVGEFRYPLLSIAFFRLIRLVQDLFNYGITNSTKKHPLNLEGGIWSLFLFFAVIVAPFVAKSGPNPFGGLLVFALLKMGGELLYVWISRFTR
ncbi:hypothetical protein JW960_15465 [candidate division KSB1 bacterium]|nr:hypothetical protein [candidate division KSB1 bacterium]